MSKVDRRILKSQKAIEKAIIELISEKKFDDITMQDISDKANVSRGTIYLHYMDKFDILDKLMEEHINKLRELNDLKPEIDFMNVTLSWFEYFESNYLFFSTMLVGKGASCFRKKFLEFIIEQVTNKVSKTVEITHGVNEDIIIQFISWAYIGVLEWWLSCEMPFPPHIMAKQICVLLVRKML